ncbi:Mediator of RNA polymerase II transcription subunit 10 [Rhizophlyctis rosea]|nr:Mediator of RNA polymerase II transcription subunit 10 [Rhizophlyctis rosea]
MGPSDLTTSQGSGNPLEALDVKLQEIVDVLFKVGITLYDLQPESSEVLFDRIDDYTRLLGEVSDLKDSLDVPIPQTIIGDYLDQGTNPAAYNQQLLRTLADKNQQANGRVQSLRNLFEQLLQTNHPDLLRALHEKPEVPLTETITNLASSSGMPDETHTSHNDTSANADQIVDKEAKINGHLIVEEGSAGSPAASDGPPMQDGPSMDDLDLDL